MAMARYLLFPIHYTQYNAHIAMDTVCCLLPILHHQNSHIVNYYTLLQVLFLEYTQTWSTGIPPGITLFSTDANGNNVYRAMFSEGTTIAHFPVGMIVSAQWGVCNSESGNDCYTGNAIHAGTTCSNGNCGYQGVYDCTSIIEADVDTRGFLNVACTKDGLCWGSDPAPGQGKTLFLQFTLPDSMSAIYYAQCACFPFPTTKSTTVIPISGDFLNEGVTRVGYFDTSSSTWYIKGQADSIYGADDISFKFGCTNSPNATYVSAAGDIPMVRYYDICLPICRQEINS